MGLGWSVEEAEIVAQDRTVWKIFIREVKKSEVNSRIYVTFRGHNEYAWSQRLRYEVRGQEAIKGHTYHRIDL